MIKKLITKPTAPAVTLDDIKYHLRIDPDDTDHDDRLNPYLQSAIFTAEDTTGRALITQTWDLMFKTWAELEEAVFLFGSLQAVTHIKYQDVDGAEQTVSVNDYLVDGVGTDEGHIIFHDAGAFSFPDLWESDPITVRIVVGYGDAATDVPDSIQSAIKLLVSDLENGDDSSRAINALLNPYRLWQL